MEQALSVGDWRSVATTADSAFLLAFSSLFSIINPIGGALIFYGFTKDFSSRDRVKVAARVGFYSLLIMFGALWTGTYILSFFGVSIDALRIAGGMVIALSGFQLLTTSDSHPDQKRHEREPDADRRRRPDAARVLSSDLAVHHRARHHCCRNHDRRGAAVERRWIRRFFLGASLAAFANAAIVWIAYRFADRLTGLIGPTARQVIVRLTAFLLMCIGVQILVTAISQH